MFLGVIIIIIALGIGWICSDLFENISKLKRVFYYASGIDLLLLVLVTYSEPDLQKLNTITMSGLFLFISFPLILFLIGAIYFYASVIFSAWNKMFPPSRKILWHSKSKACLRSLMRLILSEEEEENIVGDLLEEFQQFASNAKAYLWLSKQLTKSVWPLIYKNVTSRLASYFGERVR